jgi:hypothetical protein
MIGLGVRGLADELNCSKDTAARALLELDGAGLAGDSPRGQFTERRTPYLHSVIVVIALKQRP